MRTDVNTSGLAELDARLERMAATAVGLEEAVFPLIAADFHRIESERFAAEGPGWDQLAPRTQRHRQRHGKGPTHPILRFDGHLEESLTTSGAEGNADRVEVNAIFLGTRVPYAAAHQHGVPAHRLPARQIVALDVEDAHRWGKLVAQILHAGGHLSTSVEHVG